MRFVKGGDEGGGFTFLMIYKEQRGEHLQLDSKSATNFLTFRKILSCTDRAEQNVSETKGSLNSIKSSRHLIIFLGSSPGGNVYQLDSLDS